MRERQNNKNNKRTFSKKTKYSDGPRIGKSKLKVSVEEGKKKPLDKISLKKSTQKNTEAPVTGDIRLNRFIANSGICSRREADTYIAAGVVKINGKIVTALGTKVKSGDKVESEGRIIRSESKVYIALNKPKSVISAVSSDRGERTVIDIVRNCCSERLYPVGRLDKNTTGVLLLTNDGDMTKRLTHPSSNIKKLYHASLDKSFKLEDMQKLADGIVLEDGAVKADEISYIDGNKREVGIQMHSGKNRIVRRMFEHLGYDVKNLDRVLFAGITKKNIPRGKWRFLTPKEVDFLKMK
jgi:23S rRNA pseudouridine2605 synthase